MKPLPLLMSLLLALPALAGLVPELLTVDYSRETGDAAPNTNVYVSGTSLQLTNCVALISPGVTQDLTSVFVVLKVGNENTNFTYAATVTDATDGRFSGLVTLPTHAQLNVPVELETDIRVQCTLTNAAGTVFTYRGSKLLTVRSGLLY